MISNSGGPCSGVTVPHPPFPVGVHLPGDNSLLPLLLDCTFPVTVITNLSLSCDFSQFLETVCKITKNTEISLELKKRKKHNIRAMLHPTGEKHQQRWRLYIMSGRYIRNIYFLMYSLSLPFVSFFSLRFI